MPDGLTLGAWLVFLTARLAFDLWSGERRNQIKVSAPSRSGK
jgi:hypothetical protein